MPKFQERTFADIVYTPDGIPRRHRQAAKMLFYIGIMAIGVVTAWFLVYKGIDYFV